VRDFWREDRGQRPRLEITLIRRERPPFEGKLALPGTVLRIQPDDQTGLVDATDLDAARRVLRDKVGVHAPHLEQLYTWFTRDADPSSAGVRLYITLAPAPALDGNYAVVGKGVDVHASCEDQRLLELAFVRIVIRVQAGRTPGARRLVFLE